LAGPSLRPGGTVPVSDLVGVGGKDRWRPARNCATAEQQDAAGQAARKGKTDGASRPETIVEGTRAQVAAEGVDPGVGDSSGSEGLTAGPATPRGDDARVPSMASPSRTSKAPPVSAPGNKQGSAADLRCQEGAAGGPGGAVAATACPG